MAGNRILFAGLLLFIASLNAPAQPVTFVREPDRLAPVPGYFPFADCVTDMDGDRLDDVVRVGGKGIHIDFQQAGGSFRPAFFPLPVTVMPTWSICAGDLDNDGYTDLLFAGDSAVSFTRAMDGGRRYQETVMHGLIRSQRSTMADIDNDGLLDGFVCDDKARSVPYRNSGEGQMAPDTNLIRTADRPGNYAAIWTDYDNDGDPDLHVSKCQAGAPPGALNRTNLLYRNDGQGVFEELAASAGVADNAQSWCTVFEDFDNDGDFDAFVVNHDEQNRLYRNNGDGTFTDVIAVSGIDAFDLGAFECSAGDFNNDGSVDIFAQLRQELYLGKGDLTFVAQDAPVFPGAIGDLDDDGYLDIVRLGQYWRNQPGDNHWVKVALVGLTSNRSGIGARVEVYGLWGVQVREVRAGQGYSPMSSLMTHFGLAQSGLIDSLVVRWPSGIVTRTGNIPVDNTYVIPEAPCLLPAVALVAEGPTSLCPGASVSISAPNGFDTYRWSDGQSGSSITIDRAGRYEVICTDSAGCVAISQVMVIAEVHDTAPQILAPDGLVACAGDTLTLIATAGENPQWSDGQSGTLQVSVFEAGQYAVSVDAICSDEQLTSPAVEVTLLHPEPPIVLPVTVLPGEMALLSAMGEDCHWYHQPVGGEALAVGPTFATPPVSGTTTYYVESHERFPGEMIECGKADTTGGPGLPGQGGWLEFDAWAPFRLESVTVYVPDNLPAGVRTVQLWSGDSLIVSRTFEVQPGAQVLALAMDIRAGRYTLRCPQGNLLRNAGALAFPYAIGNVGLITSSSFGDGFYYYFYAWTIRTPDHTCVSERIPVDVLLSATEDAGKPDVLTLWPVPARDEIHVRIGDHTTMPIRYAIYNVHGVPMSAGGPVAARTWICPLGGLPSGHYYIRIETSDNLFTTSFMIIR